MSPYRIAICTPCQDTVNAGFALDLALLVGFTNRNAPEIETAVIQNRGTIIPQQRAVLVMAAQEFRASYILWIDSDMRFPKDALFQLLARERAIVAANYPKRRQPILPTAGDSQRGFLFTTPESTGLVGVTECGMGLMLTDMDVFKRLPKPWFQHGYTPKDGEYVGEDFYFCRAAKREGYTILIDQDLSKQVRHAGEIEWTQDHAIVTRDALTEREREQHPSQLVGADNGAG